MAVIFNQKKQEWNPLRDNEIPTYVFDGSREDYEKLRKEKKLKLVSQDKENGNIYDIDPKAIRK